MEPTGDGRSDPDLAVVNSSGQGVPQWSRPVTVGVTKSRSSLTSHWLPPQWSRPVTVGVTRGHRSGATLRELAAMEPTGDGRSDGRILLAVAPLPAAAMEPTGDGRSDELAISWPPSPCPPQWSRPVTVGVTSAPWHVRTMGRDQCRLVRSPQWSRPVTVGVTAPEFWGI